MSSPDSTKSSLSAAGIWKAAKQQPRSETVYLVLFKEYAHGPKWLAKDPDFEKHYHSEQKEYSRAFKMKTRAASRARRCNAELRKIDTDPASFWKAYPVEVELSD